MSDWIASWSGTAGRSGDQATDEIMSITRVDEVTWSIPMCWSIWRCDRNASWRKWSSGQLPSSVVRSSSTPSSTPSFPRATTNRRGRPMLPHEEFRREKIPWAAVFWRHGLRLYRAPRRTRGRPSGFLDRRACGHPRIFRLDARSEKISCLFSRRLPTIPTDTTNDRQAQGTIEDIGEDYVHRRRRRRLLSVHCSARTLQALARPARRDSLRSRPMCART